MIFTSISKEHDLFLKVNVIVEFFNPTLPVKKNIMGKIILKINL